MGRESSLGCQQGELQQPEPLPGHVSTSERASPSAALIKEKV